MGFWNRVGWLHSVAVVVPQPTPFERPDGAALSVLNETVQHGDLRYSVRLGQPFQSGCWQGRHDKIEPMPHVNQAGTGAKVALSVRTLASCVGCPFAVCHLGLAFHVDISCDPVVTA